MNFDLSASSLWFGMMFGTIGMAMFIYGKKAQLAVPLVAGIALIVFPFFVSSTWLLVLIGTAITAVPFLIRGI